MKLLISGATGFIGKHLTEKLLQDNNTLCVIVRPGTKKEYINPKISLFVFNNNINELTEFMKLEKFDGVIHLASLFLAQHKSEQIGELLTSNITFSTELLEASVASGTPWFINTGTFWQHYNNKKYSPANLYAATKQAFETIAQYYVETSPITFVTIQLSDTFGANDTRAKVFNLWEKASTSGETLDMSPGEQLIDINNVDNIVSGFIHMTKLLSSKKIKKMSGKSFVISSNKIISLKKLAKLFEKIRNTKLNINWGGREYRNREVMIPWNKGEVIPGWKPPITLEEGIRKTLDK